jgi:hypothetical protein
VTGAGRAGKDEAREVAGYQRALVAATNPAPLEYQAPISYLVSITILIDS